LLTVLTLPGGGRLGVYQPRHAQPPQVTRRRRSSRKTRRTVRPKTATRKTGAAGRRKPPSRIRR
jgi:hypothetical protein